MRSRFPFLAAPVLAVLAIGAVFEQPTAAQYGRRSSAGPDQLEWENNRVRLRRIAVDPGATAEAGAAADRVLVYLTADQDGRMPEAEAVWQGAGSGALQNRGNARLEAIAIELKGGTSEGAGGTPPEAFSLSYRVDVRRLIDNPRVLVTKHRYAPATYADPLHFHSEDMLVVYLRGGYTWPAWGWGAYRVRRGEFEVIPANSLHTLGNAGSDPLEFLVILPR